LKVWLLALRPFSFTASIVPAVYGGSIAVALRGRDGIPMFSFDVFAFVVCIVGCIAVHSASNLVNDYFDFKSGVDRADNFGSVNVLVRRTLRPQDVKLEAAIAFAVAGSCGAILMWRAAGAWPPLFALIAFGALSAYFYTAPPFAFKNRGFGDLQVMISFALAMVFGSYYVQAHVVSWLPVIAALPVGLLVVDILHINNLRDLETDRSAGVRTIAIGLGDRGAKRLHHLYVIGAYVTTIALAISTLLSPWTLLVLAALPNAATLGSAVNGIGIGPTDPAIVVKTARFHALFGALLIAGVIAGIVLSK
jgi:1,4-dihydroxy-2-naphthoate octaprenyltransferase